MNFTADVLSNMDNEIEELLEAIFEQSGYDLRGYSRASIQRRITGVLVRSGYSSVAELRRNVSKNTELCTELLSDLMVNVTEMFRDPKVYSSIRREVVPILRTYPSIRIWHAGCSTGEEVYSMAILLKEEGLYDRSFLYGTDVSPRAIEFAKQGVYSARQIQSYTANYLQAGGTRSLTNYFTANSDSIKLNPSLAENILFSQHNLVTDEVFSEVHMIFCRNVLIYFSKVLQDRALDLFYRGLVRQGYLCLGTKETTEFSKVHRNFKIVLKNERIYRTT